MSSVTAAPDTALLRETATRRTFAIISHPDAGKTTLTEKFLLYAGAVHEAGAVKSRKVARATTSDWMELERQRGISISSTVLHFGYEGWRFNLLDTPGHADFSEDTYRTLCAADAAVMVLDLAKGLEPQTLKLFRVCRDRGLPIVTFVNKCDRPGLPPLGILDEIRERIGLDPVPVTWPVADGADFAGIVDRRTGELVRFSRADHGATVAAEEREPLATADPRGCPPDRWRAAVEELELLDLDQGELDRDAFLAGRQTPVFFGSALANFGVRLLLRGFAELAPAPGPQAVEGGPVAPARELDEPFSALVFKVQANMDPRHRDRVAFLRVCSGRFSRGMTAVHGRTGRPLQLKYAHQLFAQDRETVDAAVPGDIVGVVNATGLLVGDTLYDGKPVAFPPIPTFAPERFTVARNRDSSRYKQFRRGLAQLDEEGVVHVLRRPETGDQEPILAGVGQLQFEVATYRMAAEFGCEVTLVGTPWRLARVIDAAHAPALRGQRDSVVVTDREGRVLVLFTSPYALRWAAEDHPEVRFAELGVARREA
ncbi:peptide chain release factor 3 [soil metagenome]|jgi:peptide chain release factor 3|nr:peptide chain release factor 3 [Euzebyaceae bacterium]